MLRHITSAERLALEARGCRLAPGCTIETEGTEPLDSSVFSHAELSGRIEIHGRPARVTMCRLHDVSIHNGAVIEHTGDISNYEILEGATVSRTGSMTYLPGSSHRIDTFSEAGGFTVTSRPGLTVAEAEAEVFGHREAADYSPDRGTVGRNASVIGASSLRSVIIGERARVGTGVIAECTVIDNDARVADGAMAYRCHIGRGCTMSKGFTAHDSLFFDNSTMEAGEAAAVFVGPHAVSCHKSTLLIGCRCSFFNAGSGTNMSNHAYRLGPIHHGTLLPGCKTASNTYILWPATFGAGSLIVGNHKHHPDTTDLPFSYLIEEGGNLSVVPAVALKGAGLLRDLEKWPKRDNRIGCEPIDCSLMTPDILAAMSRGMKMLEEVRSDTVWQGYTLTVAAAAKGYEYYRMALTAHYCGGVVKAMEEGSDCYPEGFARWWGNDPAHLSREERQIVIIAWRDAALTLLRLAKADAQKEFLPSTRRTLGTPDTNPFMQSLEERIERVSQRAARLLEESQTVNQ